MQSDIARAKELDIIKFINSKDIAKHLTKIGYVFSPKEAMYLIHAGRHSSISEKHEAYGELISLYPVYPLKVRVHGGFKEQKLASFLAEYMARESKLIDEFLADDGDSVYTAAYSSQADNGWNKYGDVLFRTFKECYTECVDDDDESDILSLRICKKSITSNRTLQAELSRDGTINSIKVAIGECDEVLNAFENMWISVPTPFKFGDILCVSDGWRGRAFVLADLCTWGGRELAEMGFADSKTALPFGKHKRDYDIADRLVKRLEECGDESDMVGNGYVYSECGLGYDHFFPYLDFEFYRGVFDDNLLPLKAISAFMKDEISDMNFVNAMRVHDARRHLKESEMLLGCFTPTELEKAGLKKHDED